ncbi:dihydrofolate reductase [Vibrio parahaemolyticus]
MIKMIAAISNELAIGKNNKLLWHIPEDLQWFKSETSDQIVVMGSKTWESLPFRPLPNRRNLVLSRDPNAVFEGAETVSFEQVIELSKGNDVIIIGGGEIYRLFINYADSLLITRVNISVPDADSFFPEYKDSFKLERVAYKGRCQSSGLIFAIEIYDRQ